MFKSATNMATLATTLNSVSEWLNAKAKKASKEASEDSAKAEKVETEQTEKNTQANIKNLASEKLKGKSLNVKKGPKVKGVKKGGIDELAAGKAEVKAAAGNLAKSIGNVVKATGPLLIAIGLITAGGLAFSAIWNRTAKQADKAAEQAQKMGEELSRAKSQYDSFSSAASNYDSAISGLDGLVKGTAEYKEAVFNANEEALKLIDTYKGLKYEVDDDSGLIIIDQDALDEAKKTQLEILENTQRAKITLDQKSAEKDLEVEKQKLLREDIHGGAPGGFSSDNFAGVAGGALAGAGVGTAIAPGIGTLIGAIAGLGVGLVGTTIGGANSNEDEAIDQLVEAYQDDGNAIFANFEETLSQLGIDGKLADSLMENKDAVKELVESMGQNKNAIDTQNQLMAEQIASEIEGFN
jgi:hypothetical protein